MNDFKDAAPQSELSLCWSQSRNMSNENLIVKCSLGSLQGSILKTEDGASIYSFQGVPYGKPPIGDLRFKDPIPIEAWSGVKSALNPPPKAICPAMNLTGKISIAPGNSEDCLYLNIYTPEVPNANLNLPVMVYIHGGGFTMGTGNAETSGPEFLVPHGIILVTINYRLGALGFLSFKTPECPGNYGLKDQSLGLRWIKNNISAFGGNPDNVTIFGVSAGSASVHYQMISPLSRGLFQRVIAQSGSATNRWAFSRHPVESGLLLAEKIAGKKVTSTDEALNILKNATPLEIITHSDNIYPEVEGQWAGEHICKFGFVPTVEPPNTPNPFLTKTPQQALDDGDCMDVPNISGVCSHEGIFILPGPDFVPDANNLVDFEKLLPKETDVKVGSPDAAVAAKKLIDFYFPNGITQEGYIQAASDTMMSYNIAKAALEYAKTQKSPIYFYIFSGGREASFIKKLFNLVSVKGTSHADDVEFLFTYDSESPMMVDPILKGTKDEKVKNLLTKIWTDFAKDGKVPAEWKPVTASEMDYVEITDIIEPKKGFYAGVIQLWDDIYDFLTN